MRLVRIAARVAASFSRVSLQTILDAVKEGCPSSLREDVGKFLGSGLYGEAYEVDGGDKVLKVSVSKSEAEAKSFLNKLRDLQALPSDVFCEVFDYGTLCDVHLPGTKYMVKDGTAYFYVMERLVPIPPSEVKIAVRTIHDLKEMSSKPDYAAARKKYAFVKRREYVKDGDIEPGSRDPLAGGMDMFDRMTAAGVDHRDIHGGNLMVNSDGRYKLVDLESALILPR